MAMLGNGTKVTVTRGSQAIGGVILKNIGGSDYVVKTNGGQMLAVNFRDIEVDRIPPPAPAPVNDEPEVEVEVEEESATFDELMALKKDDLVQLAVEGGLPADGTKKDIVERLLG